MDLNPTNIEENLLPMLEALEKAHFVSMDFELSGISTKNTKKRSGRSAAHRHGVQTLQERYEDIVDAAEKYAIIQVGITIVIEDQKVHKYMSKTYNMYLSFLDQAKVGVSRSVTLQDIGMTATKSTDNELTKEKQANSCLQMNSTSKTT